MLNFKYNFILTLFTMRWCAPPIWAQFQTMKSDYFAKPIGVVTQLEYVEKSIRVSSQMYTSIKRDIV